MGRRILIHPLIIRKSAGLIDNPQEVESDDASKKQAPRCLLYFFQNRVDKQGDII